MYFQTWAGWDELNLSSWPREIIIISTFPLLLNSMCTNQFFVILQIETPHPPPQAALSVGLSRQEYWSGLPSPPPEDLPDPGMEPASLMTSALAACSLPLPYLGSTPNGIFTSKWQNQNANLSPSDSKSKAYPILPHVHIKDVCCCCCC